MNEKRPLVLYHANCSDGFCAAWVAHKKFGAAADYLPVQYGQSPPDVAGRRVFILDFSYKRPVMRSLLSQAEQIVVLDHHKTAESELAGLVDEFVQRPDLIANPPGSHLPVIHFDMGKSGGRLAWDYFFGDDYAKKYENADSLRPWLVDYTEDRDLWRWKLPDSRELSAWLASVERSFEAWGLYEHMGRKERESCVEQGAAILRYQSQMVDSICANANEIDLDGHRVLSVNTSILFSEVAGKLAEGRPFGVAWFQRQDGKRVHSLRSTSAGVDVSEIAKRHGGGGHRNAAGFEASA